MPPYRTHYQFAFKDHQRNIMRDLAGLVRTGLEENHRRGVQYAADGQPERLPLAPLDQLLVNLAKFTYNLDESSIPKVSLSEKLLILFLFELMQKIDRNPTETEYDATSDEYLRLYYFLSFDYAYYHTTQDYHGISDQVRPSGQQVNDRESEYVNTAGMNEVAVFTALYNAAAPEGLGFLQDEARNISEEEGAVRYYARELFVPDWGVEADEAAKEAMPFVSHFDYVDGRVMKISRRDIEEGIIKVTTFNEYNGE